MAQTDHDEYVPPRMRRRAGIALAAMLAAASPMAGCGFAVNHPAVTAGVVGGALGFATCKLASDDLPPCLGVAGGAGAFLGLVAAAALWLGGDGHTVLVEEQAKPLPEDGRPIRHHPRPVDPEDPAPAAGPAPITDPTPPAPAPAIDPTPPAPAPATYPAPTAPSSAAPAPTPPISFK